MTKNNSANITEAGSVMSQASAIFLKVLLFRF